MTTLLRSSWAVAFFAAGLALAAGLILADAALPEPPEPVGGPDPNPEQRRFEKQQAERELVWERRRERAWILSRTAAGHLSLVGAAARLWTVERQAVDPGYYVATLRWGYPGRSDLERLCRKVIHDVRSAEGLPFSPGEAALRLERDFAAHRARFSTAPLPDVGHE
jgi:hypothetical protein